MLFRVRIANTTLQKLMDSWSILNNRLNYIDLLVFKLSYHKYLCLFITIRYILGSFEFTFSYLFYKVEVPTLY